MDNDGYEIPLHRAITQPILWGGVPERFFIVNMAITAIIAIPLHMIVLGIAFGIVIHTLLAWLTKRDPHFADVLPRHLKQPSFWQ